MDAAGPMPPGSPQARPTPGGNARWVSPVSHAAAAHARRCRAAGPPPGDAEVARLVAEFLARGGKATRCPPAHLLPIRNGAGSDAARWTA
jgi:hypothetical protein